MTKKKFGPTSAHCYSYCKTAGEGWEVGFCFQGKTLFVGNFVHKTDATKWFSQMNGEIASFSKKYTWGPTNMAFFKKFIGNHLYSRYYTWLDKVFTSHKNHFKKALGHDLKQYATIKNTWINTDRTYFYKRAA